MFEFKRYVNLGEDLFVVRNLIGAILEGVGIAYLIPVLLMWFYPSEVRYVYYFAIPGFMSILLGAWLSRHQERIEDVNLRQAMISAAFIWLFASFVSVVPFMEIAGMSFIDSYFESMSAWTGTGLTMMSNLESYPRVLLFWRAWMQWLGGIGIVLVALTVLIRPGVAAARLYKAEARSERILPNLANTAKVIFQIYFALTLVGAYLYHINGMNLFDAITHSMTGLGTGGMSGHDASIGYFHSMSIEAITIFLMILGAVNFTVHYKVFKEKRLGPFFDDIQVRYMFLFLIPAISIIAYGLVRYGDGIADSLRQAIFHAVSAITCTGFGISDLSKYPELSKFIIALLMVIGGGAGSTAGGIKLIRFTLMYESLKWTVQQSILPKGAVIRRKVGSYVFTVEDLQEVTSFTMTYLAFLLLGTLYVMIRVKASLVDAFFEVASAQGNVGLSVGITSPFLPPDVKTVLIFLMWTGRLEIFSILVFLVSVAAIFRRR
ncbi:TrkH family potassium uptake protein [Thermococcus gammatolerans]|uniref:Potassium uptake protein, TrkH family (TrkG/H) n=1 Tax=Thermococcus gammatolerans (strain DSM 15229 / JCM 11827 / EJ3) TaxID=593117 RepID=C5A547_THEGJ|nr:TrkH family potassium uptake protein [Thermococcus gammatolerans]ACS33359.1 Potassium uptake protein, TrkH family (trkG/H) [Thermococcus gammatolerans EJ3]